jgi:hypothetical protein
VSSNKAQVYLRKEATAQSQLDAAIRMTLADEDELAIHSVAAAAYGVSRSLNSLRPRFLSATVPSVARPQQYMNPPPERNRSLKTLPSVAKSR